jgi:hypothetical protein
MSAIEDRIRAATRAAANTVNPGSVPPLRLPGRPRDAQPRHRWPFQPPPRGWLALLVPLAAAAAVAGVVAASLAISAIFHGHARAAGPGPATHPGPAALAPVALRPVALRQVPRYFAALTLTGPVQVIGGEAAVVRSTLTGHVLATVTPPRPYRIFTWVSAAADDRTFVLAAQRYWPIGSGQAGLPAENRDNATPTVFFKLAFDPATHTAKLARLAVPGTIRSAQLAGMTVSPDGTRLALDLRQSIQVVTLATGAIRSWAGQGGGWIGNNKPIGQIFSWAADGTTLEFQQWEPGGPADIRLLDTTAPGTSLASSKIVLTFPNGGAFGGNTLLTPDGTRIVTATPQGITEFSARTGNPILSQDQFYFDWQKLGWAGPPWQDVLWAGPGGQALVVSDPRGKPGRYGPGNVLGVLTANTFTPIPHGTYSDIQIAW